MNLVKPSTFHKRYKEITIHKLNKIVTGLNEKIQNICQDCGASSIDDTFYSR